MDASYGQHRMAASPLGTCPADGRGVVSLRMEMDHDNPQPPPPLSSVPPPLNAPPVINTPPPAKHTSKGRGWKIFALVLLVLLLVSVLSNIGQFVERFAAFGGSHRESASPDLERLYIEDSHSKNNIAVVSVEGIIASGYDGGYDMVELIRDQLNRAAEASERVRAVILKVNSPGGEVLASDEIASAIRQFQEDTGIPVVASMGSLAASGGYYVSAPCRWIVANELTITGSIGVIMHGWNYRGLMDKVGLKPDVYKSGKFKDMLSGERREEDISPEERAMVQGLIDETFQKFKSVVADGRTAAKKHNQPTGRALASDWESYADGRVLSGTKAHELGFVDEMGNFDTAVNRAEKLAGLKHGDSNLIEYTPRHDLASILRLFGQTESRTMKLDFGMKMPDLPGGRLYFVWPGYLR